MAKKSVRPKSDGADRTILINFVLDKSGSMECIREATISGFNEFKNDQGAEQGRALLTLTLFDTDFTTVCEAVPMREVPDLDRSSYAPDGLTALYDAIGRTMRITDDFVAAHRPDQVLFVIMTDGQENASREFTRERVFEMIQDRQKLARYEFMYLGANQDSYAAGVEMGMRDGRMLDYAATDEGSRGVILRASNNVRAHRRRGAPMSAQFFSPAMERLGSIPVDEWQAMSPDERQRLLDEGGEKHV